jgi:hypothetical protein
MSTFTVQKHLREIAAEEKQKQTDLTQEKSEETWFSKLFK